MIIERWRNIFFFEGLVGYCSCLKYSEADKPVLVHHSSSHASTSFHASGAGIIQVPNTQATIHCCRAPSSRATKCKASLLKLMSILNLCSEANLSTEYRNHGDVEACSASYFQHPHECMRMVLFLHQQRRPGIWRFCPYDPARVWVDLYGSPAQVSAALLGCVLCNDWTRVPKRSHEQERHLHGWHSALLHHRILDTSLLYQHQCQVWGHLFECYCLLWSE